MPTAAMTRRSTPRRVVARPSVAARRWLDLDMPGTSLQAVYAARRMARGAGREKLEVLMCGKQLGQEKYGFLQRRLKKTYVSPPDPGASSVRTMSTVQRDPGFFRGVRRFGRRPTGPGPRTSGEGMSGRSSPDRVAPRGGRIRRRLVRKVRKF
jgi:hypothetical protein